MESSEHIFADLLSSLEPDSVKHEPQIDEQVSMEQVRQKNAPEVESVPRSESPILDTSPPTVPQPTKDEIQSMIRETMKETLYSSLTNLGYSLKTSLTTINQKLNKVETMCQELDLGFKTLKEDYELGKTQMEESINKVEDSLKEVSLGVQRMLEKQDLIDAHVLLNKYSKEEPTEEKKPTIPEGKPSQPPPQPPPQEEVKVVKKTKKKKPVELTSSEEEEEEEVKVVVPKKRNDRKPPAVSQEVYIPSLLPPVETHPPVQVQPPRPTTMVGSYTAQQQPPPGSGYSQPVVQNAYKPPTSAYPTQDTSLVQQMGSNFGTMPHPPTERLIETTPPPRPPQQYQNTTPSLPPPPQYQQQRPELRTMPYTGYPSLPNAAAPVRPPPMQSYPPPPAANPVTFSNPAAARQVPSSTAQMKSVDQVIDDVTSMGFDRTLVNSVVTDMLDRDGGKGLDMNVVIDRLMSRS